jgi:hypothetical protein
MKIRCRVENDAENKVGSTIQWENE